MAGRRRTAKGGGTSWFPIAQTEEATLDGLAANASGTLVDVEIEDRGTGVAYTKGAIVSFRLWCAVKPEAIVEMPPKLHVLIIPAGEGIPQITTEATLKQAEHFHWAMKLMRKSTGDPSATSLFEAELEIKTARRFRQGDRFVVQLHNMDSAVAYGAAAVATTIVDAYVRMD